MAKIEDVRIGAKFIIEAEVVEIDPKDKMISWNEYKFTGVNILHRVPVASVILFELPNRPLRVGDDGAE